jgi:5-methylcytosine-specific restriction protein A
MKLANFQSLDPAYRGAGLDASSKSDSDVWNEFRDQSELVAQLANAIKVCTAKPESEIPTDDEEAMEGRILTRVHRFRERNQAMVQKRKKQRVEECGSLTCEACGFDFAAIYGERGTGFAECHHKVPLSESGETKTRVEDLAVLCANCHRMIHVRKPMITVDELRVILAESAVS